MSSNLPNPASEPRWAPDASHASETLAMLDAWRRRWPESQPADARSLTGPHLRLHTLPLSKEFPNSGVEYATILSRHSTLILELLAFTHKSPEESLVVITRSWSDSAEPIAREPWLERLVPASWQLSHLRDPDDEDSGWTHVYSSTLRVSDPALVSLLILVADSVAADVAIMPTTLEWVYSPYPGGMDIRVLSEADCERLKVAHADWLPAPDDLDSIRAHMEADVDVPGWEFRSYYMPEATARRLAQVAEDENLLLAFGRVVDPRRDLSLELGRTEAQLIHAVLTNESAMVLDRQTGLQIEFSPDEARTKLEEVFSLQHTLNDFIEVYGYRDPLESSDGTLPGKFKDPELDYTSQG